MNFMDVSRYSNLFYSDFKTESEYLKNKRKESIEKDAKGANMLLVNNPNRPIALYRPTVLV